MHSNSEKCIQNFWSENLNVSDDLENLGAERKIILKWVLKE